MSEIQLLVPDIGGDDSSAEVIEILFQQGATLNKEDIVVVLESDKATMEIPCEQAGTVKQLLVKIGAQVKTGDVLALIETGEAGTSSAAPVSNKTIEKAAVVEAAKEAVPSKAAPAPVKTETPKPAQAVQSVQAVRVQDASYRNPHVHAGPAARRLARELGVDLALVKPSGPKERVLKDDIKAFVKNYLSKGGASNANAMFAFELPEVDFSKFGDIEKQKLTRIKKVSAKNLSRSWLTIPHVTQFDEADITELETFRKTHKDALKKQGVNLTPLAFLVKACANTLLEFPTFNASLENSGEHLILKKYVHIGVAVDTDEGLVVPVIRDANKKSVSEIAKELGDISEKARNKKLMPQDMQGACFSISSLGGIGGTAFTPIVNWPEVAILGVSRSQMKPVYDGKAFQPRLMLPLSLSYDHRVIDGAAAARFSRFLAEELAKQSLLNL